MILSCKNLSVQLDQKPLVKNISFDVNQPQLIGLLGPNGAGKSTLMRSIVSLLDFEGNVMLGDRDLSSMPQDAIARKIAYLPQERKVYWDIHCRDIVALGRLPHQPRFGSASENDHLAVDQAMETMGVTAFAKRPLAYLSGGEQARVLIARTLAQQTNIIVVDEPASGLDPAYQIDMMHLFKKLVSEGKTVLTSLHDLPLASHWCDRILLMKEGTLVADGDPDEVMRADMMRQVFGITVKTLMETQGKLVIPLDTILEDNGHGGLR